MSHTVVEYFEKRILSDLPEELKERFNNLSDIIWVEERWIDTRYEEFEKDEIKIPSLRFSPKDAKLGVKIAEKVFFDGIDVVNYLFGENIPKDFKELREIVEKEKKLDIEVK